jgi:hypothetical protein
MRVTARYLKEGNKCIKLDLSSKLTSLTWIHRGWLSRFGAASSLRVQHFWIAISKWFLIDEVDDDDGEAFGSV